MVSWPPEKLLLSNTNKSLKKILVPLLNLFFSIIASLFVIGTLAYAFWRFGGRLPPEALSISFWAGNKRAALQIGGLIFGSIFLIMFTTVFTLKVAKDTRRQLQTLRKPEEKDYGIMDGLHFGEGIVSVDESGVRLRRVLIDLHYKWGAISKIYQDGAEIGLIELDCSKVALGETETEALAHQFETLVRPFLQKGQQDEI